MIVLRAAFAASCLALLPAAVPGKAPTGTVQQAEPLLDRRILVMLRLPPPHLRPNASYSGAYGDAASHAARRRVALRIAREHGWQLVDDWPMPLVGVDCYVMEIGAGDDPEAAIARVSRSRHVAWAEPLRIYQTRAAPAGDPLLPVQPAAGPWQLATLHKIATGRGVTVAIVDSKIDVAHPDLSGQFAASQDFVSGRSAAPERHGTGVAGVIGARAGNGLGIAGIAPGARLMALRACWQTGDGPTLCDSLSLAKALHYAVDRGAQVINLSLSGPPDRLLARLIDIALARKMAVVAAFDPALPKGGFPASQPGVVAVGDQSMASLPPTVYLAPANDIPTTQPGGTWNLVDGSSYAAAHVSGLMALARQSGGRVLVASRGSGGVVDACATVVRTSAGCDCSCAVSRQRGSGRAR